MRTLTLVALTWFCGVAFAMDGKVEAFLTTPSSLGPTGRPWEVAFVAINRDTTDLLVPRANIPSLFRISVGAFQIVNSRGDRVEPYVLGHVLYRKTSDFKLLKPGESIEWVDVIMEGDVYVGPQTQMVECRDVPHCMELAHLRLPSDTYRLRWPHKNRENPFKTVEERAKVWIGEVWSNTLIIQTTEKEPVKVGLDVDQDTLNFQSEGKWITAYLSTGTKLDLLTGTTKFMGTIATDKIDWEQVASGEWRAGIKFPRSLVIELLKDIRGWELDGFMKVFVSAESGGKMFWGDDKIRILEDPGNAPPPVPPQGPPSSPPGHDKKKSPRR